MEGSEKSTSLNISKKPLWREHPSRVAFCFVSLYKEEKIKNAVAQMLHNNKLEQKKTLKDH